MDFIRRQKPKIFTVPSKWTKVQVNRQNSDRYPRLSSFLDQEDPTDFKFYNQNQKIELFDQSPKVEKKKNIQKKIQVLDKMGFASLIETKADPVYIMSQALKRRFSIGISDFWTGKNRQRFLKEKGYDEAFKTLKKNIIIKDLQGTNSLRKPSLPYIMDNNMKRRSLKETSINWIKSAKAKGNGIESLSSRYSEKMNEALDSVLEKCNELVQDNLELKKKNRLQLVEFKKDFEVRSMIKKKSIII